MDLNFGILNTAVMVLSVLVVLALVMDGRANWLKDLSLSPKRANAKEEAEYTWSTTRLVKLKTQRQALRTPSIEEPL
eukprot:1943413-Amphidinium_carterae.1